MRVIEFDGAEYRSLAEACKVLKVSNQKLRRLCRHYVRAAKNPAVALAWLTGKEKLSPSEPKTFKYDQDIAKGRDRQYIFKAKLSGAVAKIYK